MLLDTWYTVLSYPPQCKALLESANQAGLLDIFAVNDPMTAHYDTATAQLTHGAITAQLIRVQLHLKAAGCMPRSPVPLGAIGDLSFPRWLHVFHKDCTKMTQVWRPYQMCDMQFVSAMTPQHD